MKTLKILGLLLTYPEKDLVGALPDLLSVLKEEAWLSSGAVAKIENLAARLTMTDLLDVQEDYVDLFDRTPSLCLHLFEHVHGESRERGQAMVDLAEIYKNKGFEISGGEMPDYLPLFLEYLSTQPVAEAQENLGDIVNILAAVRSRLEKRETPYAGIFTALEEAAAHKPDAKSVERALKKESGAARTHAELDSAWEDLPAFDGQGQQQDGCSKKMKRG